MENKEFPVVYPYSFTEAKRLGELGDWERSHEKNVVCRKAIETAIMLGYDGVRLQTECAEGVITEFGYHRTAFVLANSLVKKADDGRVSRDNRDWAQGFFIPKDGGYNAAYAAANDTGVLDVFVNQYRRAYQSLGMFNHTHCLPDTTKQDFEGKVIVLSPRILSEKHLTQQDQLWLCTGGFGAEADARGPAVFATNLADGEQTRWNRNDFVGVLADSHMPDWAVEKLAALKPPEQEQTNSPAMGGLTMQ